MTSVCLKNFVCLFDRRSDTNLELNKIYRYSVINDLSLDFPILNSPFANTDWQYCKIQSHDKIILNLIIALCPIYTLYAICLNLIAGRSWNEDLVPDLGPIGFKGDFKIIQLRYCLLFMLIYVGCNAIYVAALKFIPNMVARRVSHFPTSSLITFKIKRALATTPLCHLV